MLGEFRLALMGKRRAVRTGLWPFVLVARVYWTQTIGRWTWYVLMLLIVLRLLGFWDEAPWGAVGLVWLCIAGAWARWDWALFRMMERDPVLKHIISDAIGWRRIRVDR